MSQWPFGRFLRSFCQNFLASLMMLLGLKRAFHYLHPTPVQFLTLLLGSLLTSLSFDLISEGLNGELQPVGFAAYLIPPFLLLVVGIFMAQRYGVWRFILSPVILWLAADIIVGSLQTTIQWIGQKGWLPAGSDLWVPYIYPVLFAWPTAALMFLFGRQLAWQWWLRLINITLAVSVLFAWFTTFSDQRLWYSVETVVPEAPPHITEEAAFYVQPLLLNRALAQLQEGNVGRTDWYFLGVGGAAYQRVFRREVESIQGLFDTRFTTTGHSLVLINDDDTTLSQPIATRTSISKALEAIGKKMNKDEDVLFLFLTSHGSSDGVFELSHEPLQIQSLTPQWLRDELDKADIRWRVVVISSCYSGAFIPALQNSSSLIITAAEATKASFGCTDDADFTYFGRAFFDEALRQEHSLIDAFRAAKDIIAMREQEEGFTPSQPQLSLGADMEKQLPKFEQELFPPED
ncbi:C13 family peptidase [Agitococcus lubricus]|uniref:Peptidase C13-like protein n=1 Tax=Agitococcus lubricus TaxID=1077255 RepID=A0A2T5IWF9_9GAMM|nr:C13 family peptidase [Agitococcus lubricus]PTQ88216.1 peptidase C13-like protein [Agitococcus lubricus]